MTLLFDAAGCITHYSFPRVPAGSGWRLPAGCFSFIQYIYLSVKCLSQHLPVTNVYTNIPHLHYLLSLMQTITSSTDFFVSLTKQASQSNMSVVSHPRLFAVLPCLRQHPLPRLLALQDPPHRSRRESDVYAGSGEA